MFEFYQWDVTRSLSATQWLDAEMLGWGVMSRWASRCEFWKGTLVTLRLLAGRHPGGAVFGPCFGVDCDHSLHRQQREGNWGARELKALLYG